MLCVGKSIIVFRKDRLYCSFLETNQTGTLCEATVLELTFFRSIKEDMTFRKMGTMFSAEKRTLFVQLVS